MIHTLLVISIVLKPYDAAADSTNQYQTTRKRDSLLQKQKQYFESFQHRSLYGNSININVDYPLNHPFYNTTSEIPTYEPIRILTETSQIQTLDRNNINKMDRIKINMLLNDTLPNMIKTWEHFIKVIPIQNPMNVMRQGICDNQVPVSSILNYYNGNITTDFLAFIHVDINCQGYGTLAYSHPCQLDQFDRPIIGRMVFCLDSIELQNEQETRGILLDTAIHEMGHLLGIHSQLMPYYRNSTTGIPLTQRPFSLSNATCVDGITRNVIAPSDKVIQKGSIKNRTYYEIITPLVKIVAQNQFNCFDTEIIKGARLEMMGSSMNNDCFGSHFDERLYFTELMVS